MKVLVVGNGGREHAIAKTLLKSPKVERVYCAPGNGGTATMAGCANIPYGVTDFAAIADFIEKEGIALAIVGPEVPLSLGIKDYFTERGIKTFGPDARGAKIEGSKAWAKEIMVAAGVPTAKSATFTDAAAAKQYIEAEGAPIVIKADGLAAGKGVIVAMSLDEALAAVDSLFGQDFDCLIVEEYIVGEEVSVLALTDGKTIRPLLPARDHKRIGDGDTGANTGGMGVYAPAPLATASIMERVQRDVLEPTLAELRSRDIEYCGILYAGLMVAPSGELKVLEFNCRFGDPETQAILPLLDTPLIDLTIACVDGNLASLPPLQWQNAVSVCVVIAAGGYPGDYGTADAITGIAAAENLGTIVYHAGTKLDSNETIVTNGGRVLGVTAIAGNFPAAIEAAYRGVDAISFNNAYCRRDIAKLALQ
jgi:phosphoribosylamine---glycine ligase